MLSKGFSTSRSEVELTAYTVRSLFNLFVYYHCMFSQCDPIDATQRPIAGATSGKDPPSVERPKRLRGDYVIKIGLDYLCMYLAGLRSVTEYVLSSLAHTTSSAVHVSILRHSCIYSVTS